MLSRYLPRAFSFFSEVVGIPPVAVESPPPLGVPATASPSLSLCLSASLSLSLCLSVSASASVSLCVCFCDSASGSHFVSSGSPSGRMQPGTCAAPIQVSPSSHRAPSSSHRAPPSKLSRRADPHAATRRTELDRIERRPISSASSMRSSSGGARGASSGGPRGASSGGRGKIVFLDVDGVLHSVLSRHQHQLFNRACMLRLKKIIDTAGARIVLSSAWRSTPSGCDEVKQVLKSYGIASFFDKTPQFR